MIGQRPAGGRVRALRRATALWPFGWVRIALLEDDTSMQKLVLQLLRPLRARVEVFGNGRDVLARIEENAKRFDVFLLDLMMPHEGGLTVMRTLRENHPHLLRRVILMTASGAGITDKWAPEIFAVVHKPFDGSALVTAVRACVAQTDLDLATPRAIMP